MNNKFMVGDTVKCKAGGPIMVVSTAPVPANPNLAGQLFVIGGFGNGVGGFAGAGSYTCTYWNVNTETFMQWNFHEDMLEDYCE